MNYEKFPNPQFVRENIEILDGTWQCSFLDKDGCLVKKNINVPYCIESSLSGVGYTDFIKKCVYYKDININKLDDKLIVLHFGAVNAKAKAYVNEKLVVEHSGGYTPFEVEITNYVIDGRNSLKVEVENDVLANFPSGKQSSKEKSYGCFYTRSTGIWQSVWLEYKELKHVSSFKFYPNVDDSSVDVDIKTNSSGICELIVLYNDNQVGYIKELIDKEKFFNIKLSETHLWKPLDGKLYDVVINFEKDQVKSYFGLRKVCFDENKFMINEKSVFQRLVLDQGYYKDGIYTPNFCEDFLDDIKRGIELGFNGARLHQKVFSPVFLYYCDKMGYMVWGEFPSWGVTYWNLDCLEEFTKQWKEVIERDFNHPSIIMWCPLNETWKDLKDSTKSRDVRFVDYLYSITKELDKTRPCIDVSGGYHGHKTDLFDFHCYEEYEKLYEYLKKLDENNILDVPLLYDENEELYYKEGAIGITEFGGTKISKEVDGVSVPTINECSVLSEHSWGYGNGVSSDEDFLKKYKSIVELIMSSKKICCFCYTQLYDIEQEENGFYTYDRKPKLSKEIIKEIYKYNSKISEIEKIERKV